ncbi:MAG TPA: MoxR family ATPase [Bacteroidia bacterium]|jgi:MoxR-like ATPase|nr:MoxR family ATPase [Bacteroidia bacterium]
MTDFSNPANTYTNRIPLEDLKKAVADIRAEIGKLIVGQERTVDLLIAALLSDGHVLIEGVPGVAKTLTAKLLARTISVKFSRLQFTPDLMPSDVIGTSVFSMKTNEFEFKHGPIFASIVLIDEINRAPAKTQSALFESMEERQVTVDGKTYQLGSPFMVVATQNPVEQEGTYRLPEAQLDRFLFKINVDYPSLQEETKIIADFHGRKNSMNLDSVKPVLNADQLKYFREKVYSLHVEPNLLHYIAQIVNQTRNNSALFLGASPRASLAILTSAKAIAAMRGRDFVTPDDIREVAVPVLQHRVMLTPEKEMEGQTARDVVKQIIQSVEIPR